MACEHGWHDDVDCDVCRPSRERVAELEAALREIAEGYIDEGGCRRVRSDSILIAKRALGLK